MNDSINYLLEESKFIRSSYDSSIEETRKLERYALTLTGLTWGWYIANYGEPGYNLLIWFPCFVCFTFGIRSAAIHYRSVLLLRYLEIIESNYDLPDNTGFGGFHLGLSQGPPVMIAVSAYVFWIVLQIVTILVPFLLNK